MKILDVLPKEAILADLKAVDKKGVLEELVSPVADISGVNHEDLVKVLMERERLGSTGIGEGIGIPHGKVKDLKSLILGFGRSRKGPCKCEVTETPKSMDVVSAVTHFWKLPRGVRLR